MTLESNGSRIKADFHKCASCDKIFAYNSSLIKHMRIHTGERPYLCNTEGCLQKFSQVSNLIRHKRIHSGLKPYECVECRKCFSSSSNLKQHFNIHKTNVKRNKYVCFINDCCKSYLYICTLKKHLIFSHKEEYNYLEKFFSNQNFLEIYKILKKLNESGDETPEFLNFKKEEVLFEERLVNKNEEHMKPIEMNQLNFKENDLNKISASKETNSTCQKEASNDQTPSTGKAIAQNSSLNFMNINDDINYLKYTEDSRRSMERLNFVIKLLEIEKIKILNNFIFSNNNELFGYSNSNNFLDYNNVNFQNILMLLSNLNQVQFNNNLSFTKLINPTNFCDFNSILNFPVKNGSNLFNMFHLPYNK